jgi:hypothetical protein
VRYSSEEAESIQDREGSDVSRTGTTTKRKPSGLHAEESDFEESTGR